MAKWKPFDLTWGRSIYYCTECKEGIEVPTSCGKPMYKFCPMCGARMDTADTPQTETQNSNKNSNVISVYDGVSEAVRCAMCSNPNKSDRGCDGACLYDEKLYERIMKAIAESVADTPQTDCDKCIWNVCNYNKVEWDADTPQTDLSTEEFVEGMKNLKMEVKQTDCPFKDVPCSCGEQTDCPWK